MYKKMFFIFLFLAALNQEAFAAAAGGGIAFPWDGWFDNLINAVTGKLAFAIAMLCLFAAGCTLAFANQEIGGILKTFIYVFMVICIIIAVKAVMAAVTGQGAEITVAMADLVSSC